MNKHRNQDKHFDRQERSEQPRVRHENRHNARDNAYSREDRPARPRAEQIPFNEAEFELELELGLGVFTADSFNEIFSGMQHLQQAFFLARRGGPAAVRTFADAVKQIKSLLNQPANNILDDLPSATTDTPIALLATANHAPKFEITVADVVGPHVEPGTELYLTAENFVKHLTVFDYFYEFSTSEAHTYEHAKIENYIIASVNAYGGAWRDVAVRAYEHAGREVNF